MERCVDLFCDFMEDSSDDDTLPPEYLEFPEDNVVLDGFEIDVVVLFGCTIVDVLENK